LIVLAVLIAYPAWRFNAAGLVGAQAAEAFAGQNWTAAQRLYEQAHALDPWNGSYALDLAQVNLILAAMGQADDQQVQEPLTAALRVQPYRPDLRDRAIRIYLLQGQEEQALAQADALAWLLPKEINAFVSLTELLANRAERAYRSSRPGDAFD